MSADLPDGERLRAALRVAAGDPPLALDPVAARRRGDARRARRSAVRASLASALVLVTGLGTVYAAAHRDRPAAPAVDAGPSAPAAAPPGGVPASAVAVLAAPPLVELAVDAPAEGGRGARYGLQVRVSGPAALVDALAAAPAEGYVGAAAPPAGCDRLAGPPVTGGADTARSVTVVVVLPTAGERARVTARLPACATAGAAPEVAFDVRLR